MSIKIKESDAEYMHDYVKKLAAFPRSPGSPGERKGAEMTAEMMKEFSNDIKMEEFQISPKAFLGWIKIIIPMFLISLILFKWVPLLGAILMPIVIFIFIEEFVVYHQLVDPIFPKATSQNTYGIINPTGEAKQTIIFAGHVDSPFEFNFIRWFKTIVYGILIALAIASIIFFAVICVMNEILLIIYYFNANGIIYHILVIFHHIWVVMLFIGIPIGILFFFFTTWGDTPGAGDNLSACAVAMGVGRYLQNAKQTGGYFPKHTKVMIMAFGSEEVGLRGANAFARAHKEELLAENAVLINMEVIIVPGTFYLVKKDLNGTVKCSEKVVNEVAKVMDGLNYKWKKIVTPLGAGSSDSAAFAKQGLETTCIFGIDLGQVTAFDGYLNHYHTIRDTPDRVDPMALKQGLDICLNYLKMKDEQVSS